MYVCVSDGCTANARRFFCGYPSCNTASTTAAGVTIHQKRQHLDWMDAAVNAKTGASQRGKRTKVQWTEERSEDLANLWNEVARETGTSDFGRGNPIAVAIIAKGGQFSECSVDSLKQQVKGGLAKGYLAKLRTSQPADRDGVSQRDQPERSQTLPLRQSSDQANEHPKTKLGL